LVVVEVEAGFRHERAWRDVASAAERRKEVVQLLSFVIMAADSRAIPVAPFRCVSLRWVIQITVLPPSDEYCGGNNMAKRSSIARKGGA
jgi:hypothetical protein